MKLVFLFFCLPLCKHCMLIFHCLGRNAEKGYVFSSSSHSWFCISLHSEMGCRGVRGECGEKHTRDESFLVTSLSLHLSLSPIYDGGVVVCRVCQEVPSLREDSYLSALLPLLSPNTDIYSINELSDRSCMLPVRLDPSLFLAWPRCIG